MGVHLLAVVLFGMSSFYYIYLMDYFAGGGRCNVMHNPMKGAATIAKGYPRGSKELLGMDFITTTAITCCIICVFVT